MTQKHYTTITRETPASVSVFEDATSTQVWGSKFFRDFETMISFFDRGLDVVSKEKRKIPLFSRAVCRGGRPKRSTKTNMDGALIVLLDIDSSKWSLLQTIEKLGERGVAAWGHTTFSHGLKSGNSYRIFTDWLADDWWSLSLVTQQLFDLSGVEPEAQDSVSWKLPCFYVPAVHPDRDSVYETERSRVSHSVWFPRWFEEPPTPERPTNGPDAQEISDLDELRDALEHIDNGPRDNWVEIGMALHSTREADAFGIFLEWSAGQEYGDFNVEACETLWESFSDGEGGIRLATVFHRAREQGWRPGPPPRATAGEDFAGMIQAGSALVPSASSAVAKWQPKEPRFYRDSKSQAVLQTDENLYRAVQGLELGACFDCLSSRVRFVGRGFTFLDEGRFKGLPRTLNENLCLAVSDTIRKLWGPAWSKEKVRDAVQTQALENRFHPIIEWLDGLEWDGEHRIGSWLSTYAEAEDSAYNQAVGRLLLMAACARVRRPGIKFDTMVILEGRQGCGKSSLVRTFGGEYTLEGLATSKKELHDKDVIGGMIGKWWIEFPELSSFRKTDSESLKHFISQTVDSARLPYERLVEDFPRSSVFVGTTNDKHYLKDKTGNRRFLPVEVGKVDLLALQRDRDQLLAEADAAWLENPSHVAIQLPPELRSIAALMHAERAEENIILAPISVWLDQQNEDFLSTAEIAEGALSIPPGRCHAVICRDIKKAMKEAGWGEPVQRRPRVGGVRIRGYQRPEDDPAS